MKYIYQETSWPEFTWSQVKLAPLLANIHYCQGRLMGQMKALGFHLREEAELHMLTLDVVKSSEIENVSLDPDQVRSSIARKLGMDMAGLVPSDRHVDGVVEMTLDATQQYQLPLTRKRLFDWHAALFPTGRSGMRSIKVANWRDGKDGPMQVVSGPIGREKVHFEAPAAEYLDKEMTAFLKWFNAQEEIDPLIKAGMAHLWFVTIHPFEDGNGRITRALTDLLLARAEKSAQRFYSMSAEIKKERADYYNKLEAAQKGDLDITEWLEWFLKCLDHALSATENDLAHVLQKAHFWEVHRDETFNERQRFMISKLWDDFFGNLTTSKWAKMNKCSPDTALRDIQDLIDKSVLVKEEAGGRSTNYVLNMRKIDG